MGVLHRIRISTPLKNECCVRKDEGRGCLIYCVRALDDGSFVFTIDPDPESPGAFGDHIPYTEALYNASLGTPGVDKEAYVDQWGRFYSAYSPVFDSNGNVTDIVAVDFTADWVDR